MKRAWAAAAVAGLLLIGGCGRPSSDRGPSEAAPAPAAGGKPAAGVIGVSLMTTTNPFFVQLGEAIRDEAGKHDYQVVLTSGEYDVARQRDQVNDFITTQVSAIILCPCDSTAIGEPIMTANRAGVPVFTADVACLAPEAEVVCHVATDNYGGGKLAGETMVELLGGTGQVAIIDFPEVESVIMRTKGFREVVGKVEGIKIVGAWPGGGDTAISFQVAQDVLQAHADLNAFFAINDPTGLGVATALEKAGKADRIKIIAFDAQPIGRRGVKEGRLYATIVQYPEQIGRKVVDAVARYMAAEQVEKEILIPCTVYRKADADQDPTLNDEGN